jgi:membrane associated rhomboid family serine protease
MEPESSDKFESPFNALPPVVIALTLLIIVIEVIFQLANAGIIGGPRGVGWRIAAIEEFGFSSVVLDRVLVNGDYSFDMLKRFVTYPFVNVQLTQVAFCAALTLALGKFTAEYYGGVKVLGVYLVTSIVGAVAFGFMVEGRYPLLGGFTPVYGLIGAYTYALWLRLGQTGENQLKAFRLIGFLMGLQLLFGLLFGSGGQWIAELAGFSTGFMLSTVLAPGGWAALLVRLRQRS